MVEEAGLERHLYIKHVHVHVRTEVPSDPVPGAGEERGTGGRGGEGRGRPGAVCFRSDTRGCEERQLVGKADPAAQPPTEGEFAF